MANGEKRVVFDLDGVVAAGGSYPSPDIGEPNLWATEMMEDFYQAGYAVVLYTARPSHQLPLLRAWLRRYELDWIVYDVVMDKPAAELYIDDRAFNPVMGNDELWPLAQAERNAHEPSI